MLFNQEDTKNQGRLRRILGPEKLYFLGNLEVVQRQEAVPEILTPQLWLKNYTEIKLGVNSFGENTQKID